MIRVQIETASSVTRAGLKALLGEQTEIEIVRALSDADVVLMEDLPDLPSRIPVVLLTDDASAADALRAGAMVVLPRDAPPYQIVAAIYAASAGLVAVPVEERAALAPLGHTEQAVEALTPREMDVLEMLGEGLSNKAIAYRLSISEHTAKFHVNSILGKLNAGTRTEAAMRGIRLGLIKI